MSLRAVVERAERRLEEAIGLDPVALGAGAVASAVAERLRTLGVDAAGYAERLEGEPELAALVDEVVVAESWFHREPAAFALLADHAVRVTAGCAGVYRVLSAACGGGEEPYSIALTLMTLMSSSARRRFVVEGLDVSGRQIERARAARYPASRVRDAELPAAFVERHPDGTFEISAEVRERVRFRRANLASPSLSAWDGDAPHAIFCRNVLVYLTPRARRTCLSRLVGMLAPGGLLVVGAAEAGAIDHPLLAREGPPEAFAFVRRPDHPAAPPLPPLPVPTLRSTRREPRPVAVPARVPTTPAAPTVPSSVLRGEARRHADPGSLQVASALADRGRLDEARQLCEALIAAADPTADAFGLHGAILQATGDARGAEESFLRALALEDDHEESLRHLVLLADGRGRRARAAGFRRRLAAVRERRA